MRVACSSGFGVANGGGAGVPGRNDLSDALPNRGTWHAESAAENRLESYYAIRACRQSERAHAAAVLVRKMALEFAAIVKNAGYLDHAVVAAAIEKKMARLLHP
jgi:hypothetical protein